jgi:GDPmannose 4,6-dehydratase
MTKNYREAYGVFAVSGILFNHESPRRGHTFVTKKIATAVARILEGKQQKLFLGNLDARRDWGYAPEYVVAMWKMLQSDQPKDYVIGTGLDMSVREFLEAAFGSVGLAWQDHVEFDAKYLRPTEVNHLLADAKVAQSELDWKPSVTGKELVRVMIEHEIKGVGNGVDVPDVAMWNALVR